MNFTIMPINGFFCKICKKLCKELFQETIQNEEVLICQKCLEKRRVSLIEDALLNKNNNFGFKNGQDIRQNIIERWNNEKELQN